MANELFNEVDWSKCTKKRRCCPGSSNEGQYYEVDNPCVQGARLDPTTCNCVPEGAGDYRIFAGTWGLEINTWNCGRDLPMAGTPQCNIFDPWSDRSSIQLLDIIVQQGSNSSSCCDGPGTPGEFFCPVAIKYIELSPFAPKERYNKEFTDCMFIPLMPDGGQACANGTTIFNSGARSTTANGGFIDRVIYWPDGNIYTPGARSYDLGISSPPGCSN